MTKHLGYNGGTQTDSSSLPTHATPGHGCLSHIDEAQGGREKTLWELPDRLSLVSQHIHLVCDVSLTNGKTEAQPGGVTCLSSQRS